MKKAVVLLLVAILVSLASAQTQQPKSGQIILDSIDRTVDPCTDFYQFACGNWLKKNPVPGDQPAWGRFNELAERNRTVLREILEKASAPDPNRSAVDQKIGDYYASCMDEPAINVKGLAPLKPELDRIAALKSVAALPELTAHLHRVGIRAFFNVDSEQDFKDATEMIAGLDQGGLGLPEREYYLKSDDRSIALRKQYVAHVQKMFELLGDTPAKAAQQAQAILNFETAMAKVSMDLVSRRDPQKLYNRMSVTDLGKLGPKFDWNSYLVATGAPKVTSLNVTSPEFFKGMDTLLASTPLDTVKAYLRWQAIHSSAHLLPTKFVDANFEFYAKTLNGQKEQRARWKRCVQYTDGDLGEAVGERYVERTFGADGKERTLKMVHALEAALNADIKELDWMTPETKKQALIKLEAIANKIGYPDKWRDYSKLNIVRGDALGNSMRANEFEFQRQMDKIGKPIDRKEWAMSPPTVNAYYNPQMNDINFPAGILQPPFFDKDVDDAINFGGIGAVIGHELTHGFDDMGRQFDEKGNLRDWWTEVDAKRFTERSNCIVDQYSKYEVVPGAFLNGKLTLGENVADNGGLRIAMAALLSTLGDKKDEKTDGFTPLQRIFLGWGQVWCENASEEFARLLTATNEHSFPKFRVNGVVSNFPEFQQAFGCKAGAPMVRAANACRVW